MNDMSSEKVTVTLPTNMVAQIDAQVGGGFVDREEFMRAAARHYLEYMQAANAGRGQIIG